jgi:hypothetical protein
MGPSLCGAPKIRRILVQCEMGPDPIVMGSVGTQDATQLRLVEHHQVIETYMDPASAQGCLLMLRIGCSHIFGLLLG